MHRLNLPAAVLIALGIWAGSCSPARLPRPDPIPENFKTLAEHEAFLANCTRMGGELRPGFVQGTRKCVFTYTDGGKPCTESADCQGECVGSPGRRSSPDTMPGVCQANSDLGPDCTEILDGPRSRRICF